MNWWEILTAVMRLLAVVGEIKKTGRSGRVRTKLVAEIDGYTLEFPFVSITL